jgi:ABC-type Fe3+ transport system substrate-binding protein
VFGLAAGTATSATSVRGAVPKLTVYKTLGQLVTAAKKEGTLNLYTAPEYAQFLVAGFKQQYPWAQVNVTQGEPPDTSAKLLAEWQAGIVNADAVNLKEPQIPQFADLGALQRIQVPNDNNVPARLWDKYRYGHPENLTQVVLVYNTKLVSKGPSNLFDLAGPAWANKFALDDPVTGGSGGTVLAAMRYAWGRDDTKWHKWLHYLRVNNPLVTPSSSSAIDAVVRGDRAICLCAFRDYLQAKSAGAPVGVDYYNQGKTGSGVVVITGVAVVPTHAPHQAMAALWLNWMESQAGGQAGFSASGRTPAVPVSGAPSMPTSVKVANNAKLLENFYDNAQPYIDAFNKYFGG